MFESISENEKWFVYKHKSIYTSHTCLLNPIYIYIYICIATSFQHIICTFRILFRASDITYMISIRLRQRSKRLSMLSLVDDPLAASSQHRVARAIGLDPKGNIFILKNQRQTKGKPIWNRYPARPAPHRHKAMCIYSVAQLILLRHTQLHLWMCAHAHLARHTCFSYEVTRAKSESLIRIMTKTRYHQLVCRSRSMLYLGKLVCEIINYHMLFSEKK